MFILFFKLLFYMRFVLRNTEHMFASALFICEVVTDTDVQNIQV